MEGILCLGLVCSRRYSLGSVSLVRAVVGGTYLWWVDSVEDGLGVGGLSLVGGVYGVIWDALLCFALLCKSVVLHHR